MKKIFLIGFYFFISFLLILNFNAYAEKSSFGYQIYEIDDSDINIQKLHKNIINNKKFKSKNKKYFKAAKRGKVGNKRIRVVVLSVYINYEKELLNLTNNPNTNKIDINAWAWVHSNKDVDVPNIFGGSKGSIDWKVNTKCTRRAVKLRLTGGQCVPVEARVVFCRDCTSDSDPVVYNLLLYQRDTRILALNYKSKNFKPKLVKSFDAEKELDTLFSDEPKKKIIEKQKEQKKQLAEAEKKKKDKEKKLAEAEKKKKDKEKKLAEAKKKKKDKEKELAEIKKIKKQKEQKKILAEKIKKEKIEKLLKEKKEADKLKMINKKLSLFKETELDKYQRLIEYTKKFIQLNPDEFNIVQIAKKILSVKSISEGKLNREALTKIEDLIKFTSKSKKFQIYEKKILNEEKQSKIKEADTEIEKLTNNIKTAKLYLTKNIDSIYANDLILSISESEKTLLELSSLGDIKTKNQDLNNLISKIDVLNDKIAITNDLNFLLQETLKKSLSTDLAPLLIDQIEKIEYALKNIDLKSINTLIDDTNNFISLKIEENKNEISNNIEDKKENKSVNKKSNDQIKENTVTQIDNKNNKTLDVASIDLAVNSVHASFIKEFNYEFNKLINRESFLIDTAKKSTKSLLGKKILCSAGKNKIYGFFFNGNYSGDQPTDFENSENELLVFEFDPSSDYYLAGSDRYALYDYILVRINKRGEKASEGMWKTYSIDASKNTINLSGSQKVDRNNGDFYQFIWDINSIYYTTYQKVGKCSPFDGTLIEMLNAFKIKSINHKKKQDQKLKENKF